MDTEELIGPLLQSVSRSFYLSIRLLPAGLRRPVGLAYLLARATDTVADTTQIPAEIRKPKLDALALAIQNGRASPEVDDLESSFAALQTNLAEQRLIRSIPQCLVMLANVSPEDRQDIVTVLLKITRAQTLDLEKFGTAGNIRSLNSAAELNEYTYLIAGCVGEFWTNICSRHLSNFSDQPIDEMLDLGRRYGAGLQLINILRDAGADLRAGRCYLPNDELQSLGITADRILEQPAGILQVYQKWLSEAERGVEAGMKYSLAIRSRRVRGATALPALIGIRTIGLLRDAGPAVLEEKVKVPRDEVRSMLRRVALSLASKRTLEQLFVSGSSY